MIDLDRLQSQLLTSGFQQKNNPLYQVISQLIKALKEVQKISSSGSSGGTVTNNITNITQMMAMLSDDGGDDGDSIMAPSVSSGSASSGIDHVVMSDGATPIPEPVDDGFGNFIYIVYSA